MPEARPNAEGEAEEPAAAGDDLESLKLRGDVAGLLDLAKAHRAAREMKRCFDAYVAAAELGSADAEYSVALFWMTGGVVDQDLKEGAMRLRAAAEKGSLPAKVYVGNLYELGIFYKADPEKADVWYRNAARAADVQAEAGTEEHANELAELGCVRYVLQVTEREETSEADRTRLLQRARAHGYGIRTKGDAPMSTPAPTPTVKAEEPVEALAEAPVPRPREKPKKAPPPPRSAGAIGAFAYALLFVLAGAGGGYAAMLGARELVAHGTALPGIGTRVDLVFPIVLGVVGVLPTFLVYRFGSVVRTLAMAIFLGGAGWVAWGTGQVALHPVRGVQTIAWGVAGFLAALLVLGLLGGAKRARSSP